MRQKIRTKNTDRNTRKENIAEKDIHTIRGTLMRDHQISFLIKRKEKDTAAASSATTPSAPAAPSRRKCHMEIASAKPGKGADGARVFTRAAFTIF